MLIGLTGFLYWGFPKIHRVEAPKGKSPKTLATPLELGRLGGFELKLELVCNEGDELRIRGFDILSALCYTNFGNCTTVRFGRIDRGLFTYRRGKVSSLKQNPHVYRQSVFRSSGGWGFCFCFRNLLLRKI